MVRALHQDHRWHRTHFAPRHLNVLRIENVNVTVAVSRDGRLPLIPSAQSHPYLRRKSSAKSRRAQCTQKEGDCGDPKKVKRWDNLTPRGAALQLRTL